MDGIKESAFEEETHIVSIQIITKKYFIKGFSTCILMVTSSYVVHPYNTAK